MKVNNIPEMNKKRAKEFLICNKRHWTGTLKSPVFMSVNDYINMDLNWLMFNVSVREYLGIIDELQCES